MASTAVRVDRSRMPAASAMAHRAQHWPGLGLQPILPASGTVFPGPDNVPLAHRLDGAPIGTASIGRCSTASGPGQAVVIQDRPAGFCASSPRIGRRHLIVVSVLKREEHRFSGARVRRDHTVAVDEEDLKFALMRRTGGALPISSSSARAEVRVITPRASSCAIAAC